MALCGPQGCSTTEPHTNDPTAFILQDPCLQRPNKQVEREFLRNHCCDEARVFETGLDLQRVVPSVSYWPGS